jgi:predicted alpha/beta-fold hydrolase
LYASGYRPPLLLRSGHLQTYLASWRLRARGRNPMLASTRSIILKVAGGVRLLGHYAAPPVRLPKALVILLHGWEGSSASTYILTAGRFLFRRGYAVFRLNLRDHGPTHHLNEGLFYAVLLEEVFEAVKQIAQRHPEIPVFLVGYSLGGNFVLRLLLRALRFPLANLVRAVCISPVLDPAKATTEVDAHPVIRRYFLAKWRRSLLIKQRHFPRRYDFTEALREKTVLGVTARLLGRYSNYGSPESYFRDYTVAADTPRAIETPLTIITAADDPIIPVADFKRLKLNAHTDLFIHRHGGHNGFLESLIGPSWYERYMVRCFANDLATRLPLPRNFEVHNTG